MVKNTEAQRHLESGNAFYEQGKHSEACEEYQKALDIEPKYVDADTYNMWGNALYSLERYNETIEKYLRVLEINPYSFNYINWVNTLDKLTKDAKEKAIANFQKTIELKPPDVGGSAYNEWGNALLDHFKKYDEAIEKFTKAVEMDSNYVHAHYNLGRALANLGKYEDAIEKYQEAIGIDSNYSYAYDGWGNALYELKKYDEAIEKYKKAIEIKHDDVYAHYNLGRALANLGKYEDAIEKYQEAIGIDSNYSYAYDGWGNALYELKEYEKAIEKYLRVLEIDPSSVSYVNWNNAFDKLDKELKEEIFEKFQKIIELKPADVRADVYFNWGNALLDDFKKYDEAIGKYKKAIEIDQRHAYAYRNWGLALSKLKKYDEAIEKYQRAIEINSRNVDAYNDMGLALHELKKYDEAIANYEKAVEIDSKFIYAYKNWGNALYELKEYEKAIEKYLRVLEINPYSFNYINWVNTLDKLKKDAREKAIEKFQKAMKSKTPDIGANAYDDWGNALSELKKYDEAIEKYQEALVIDPSSINYANWVNTLDKLKKDAKETAIEKFQKTIEKKTPGVGANAYYNWGNALANFNKQDEAIAKYEKAIEKYQKAIEIDPKNVDAYNGWGNALLALKKYDKAIEKYKEATEIKPDYVHTHRNWGLALANLKEHERAIEKYKEATKIDPNYIDAYFDWGIALDELKRYEEAIDKYQTSVETAKKTDPDNILVAYASHNIAALLWRQGKYAKSRKKWEETSEAYENESRKQRAIDSKNADYFLYFGSLLHEVFREFNRAEKIYKEGLELDANHVGILTKEVSLYLEIMDEFEGSVKEIQSKAEQTNAYWKAREAYNKAKDILKNQLVWTEDADTLLKLGELYLAMEKYDKAEKCLLEAHKKDAKLAAACTDLGIVYTRNQDPDYKKAVKYFKEVYNLRDREDLTIQSNLAEAYLKAGDPNMAKIEYKKILSITPFHVESHIGLGEVYSALGTDGDEDMYDKAIYHFTEGINIAENKKDKKGSKILKKKELAAALYSRGYARAKLYEASKTMKDESLLRDALEDFKRCFQNDPYNHKAKRAMEKIEKRFKDLSPHRRPEVFGPLAIFFLSAIVFISSQSSFFIGKPFIYFGKPVTLDVGYYMLLTFGSLIFMVAGLYLPQILKLKVGGIELEKSPVEQITTPSTLGISK